MAPAKGQFARSIVPAGMVLLGLTGCAHSGRVTTVGFPGALQDRFPARTGTYDLREAVDDSPDFYHGNFEPYRQPPMLPEGGLR